MRNRSPVKTLGAVTGYVMGSLGGSLLLLLFIANEFGLNDMNRRKAPERRQKIAESQERRRNADPKANSPKSYAEVKEIQARIRAEWAKCRLDLEEQLNLTPAQVDHVTDEQLAEVCGK